MLHDLKLLTNRKRSEATKAQPRSDDGARLAEKQVVQQDVALSERSRPTDTDTPWTLSGWLALAEPEAGNWLSGCGLVPEGTREFEEHVDPIAARLTDEPEAPSLTVRLEAAYLLGLVTGLRLRIPAPPA